MALGGETAEQRERRIWLADTSAVVRLASSPDAELWASRVERGLVRLAAVTRLELGFSARSGAELRREIAAPPLASMPIENLTPRAEDRATAVQLMLAEFGQHRAAAIPDLLVAATAELAGLIVLHLDRHFDMIAELTGQPVEALRVR